MRKRGVLTCCTPLLARWFISHLPQSVLKNEQGLRWSQRLMTLTHSDVHWCSRSIENVIIIDRCGEFPNVPLLGIRGGITYNPCLALRQFGYARRDGPHDMLVPDLVFDFDNCDRWEWELTVLECWFAFAFVFAKCCGKQESPPSFILSNKERTKAQKKFLFEIFLGFGG